MSSPAASSPRSTTWRASSCATSVITTNMPRPSNGPTATSLTESSLLLIQLLQATSGGRQSPALGLGHEMAHGDAGWWDRLVGGMTVGAGNYDNWEEWRVIAGPETSAANTLGEDTRTDHRGTPYPVGGPTQR